jgi:metal-dependent hydrolase (beta-lactamase superfamily II)
VYFETTGVILTLIVLGRLIETRARAGTGQAIRELLGLQALAGEPGVSYLVRAGGTRVLFDSGLSGGKPESALARNARALGTGLHDLDAVAISHLHADHVGGIRAMRAGTFSFSADPLEPCGIPAYVPAPMRHPRAEIAVTTGPRVIAPGMAVLPLLPRMLFWPGYISEQALVVSVRGFGLVLISGCGHPPIERILGTPWTFSAFAARFQGRYQTLRAGEELKISAAAAG